MRQGSRGCDAQRTPAVLLSALRQSRGRSPSPRTAGVAARLDPFETGTMPWRPTEEGRVGLATLGLMNPARDGVWRGTWLAGGRALWQDTIP